MTLKVIIIKRVGFLYEKILDMNNLRLAHKNARKGKGWYREIKYVNTHLDECLSEIQNVLLAQNYHTSTYTKFQKKEGRKMRTIYKLPYYQDRIVHWSILQIIEPYLIRNFTEDTYSSIPDRGIHKAGRKLKKVLKNDRQNCQYCFKADIKHFYQNINHNILKQKYAKIFKDEKLLGLIYEIIDSVNTAEGQDLLDFYGDQSVDIQTGIPIGNYLSQYSGNLYLSDFDHFVKEQLHVKYYFRYMDDIIILAATKEELHYYQKQIEAYLHNELRLLLKSNWQIFPVAERPIDFVGYRFNFNKTALRKCIYYKFKRKMAYIKNKVSKNNNLMNFSDWSSINSYIGWVSFCSSNRLFMTYIKQLMPHYKRYYYQIIRGETKCKFT